jgi:hypothetical protein
MKELEQSERETSRWVILMALYHGGGYPVAEALLLSVLDAVPLRADPTTVRAQLKYLKSAELADITQHPDGRISAAITSMGVDVYEYNVQCPAGIARPKKYW